MNKNRSNNGFAVLVLLTGLVMAIALGLTGTSFAQPKLKVGILHIGSIADAGYNQAHAEGAQVMKKNLPNVKLIEVENKEYGIRTHILSPGVALTVDTDSEGRPALTPSHIADWVVWLLNRPGHLRGNGPILV